MFKIAPRSNSPTLRIYKEYFYLKGGLNTFKEVSARAQIHFSRTLQRPIGIPNPLFSIDGVREFIFIIVHIDYGHITA